MSTKTEATEAMKAPASKKVEIPAPKFKILELPIRGTAPLVMHKFSQKAIEQIISTQKAGSQAGSKKKREPKDFDAVYHGAFHIAKDGWYGIPASAFRNAAISACRTVGYKMTHAKLAFFILADGYEEADGTPLVRLYGEPKRHTTYGRNDNGSVDIRVRPMWEQWNATVRIRFDADMFSEEDVANLVMRIGGQVGLLEGRPDSKNSAGLGWGMFEIDQDVPARAAA